MTEEWRDVADGTFQVSNLGRVRRNKPGPRNKPSIILRQNPNHSGYLRVCLRMGTYTRTKFVHRLVATAFLGRRPNGKQVNHKDGHKSNNAVSNLEYVTPKQNSRHAVINGLKPCGDKHYIVKDRSRAPRGETLNKGHLKNEHIQHIRKLREAGNPVAEIAELFRVTPSAISKICLRQTWAHVA